MRLWAASSWRQSLRNRNGGGCNTCMCLVVPALWWLVECKPVLSPMQRLSAASAQRSLSKFYKSVTTTKYLWCNWPRRGKYQGLYNSYSHTFLYPDLRGLTMNVSHHASGLRIAISAGVFLLLMMPDRYTNLQCFWYGRVHCSLQLSVYSCAKGGQDPFPPYSAKFDWQVITPNTAVNFVVTIHKSSVYIYVLEIKVYSRVYLDGSKRNVVYERLLAQSPNIVQNKMQAETDLSMDCRFLLLVLQIELLLLLRWSYNQFFII